MADVLLFIYAAVVGFGVAALLAGLYRGLTSEPVRFAAGGTGVLSRIGSFAFCLVVGPAIIVRHAFASARAGDTPSSWAAAGIMVAAVWSGVLGVAVLALVSRFVA